jgi:endonuclease III
MEKVHIVARQLGLADELAQGDEKALFKWLVACLLFAKPIQQTIAWRAYQIIVEEHHYDTPRKLASAKLATLVSLLGKAHYVRYDNSTAERLVKLGKMLIEDYDGKVTTMRDRSVDADDFAKRLFAFNGMGPKAVEIFMRDAAPALFPGGEVK